LVLNILNNNHQKRALIQDGTEGWTLFSNENGVISNETLPRRGRGVQEERKTLERPGERHKEKNKTEARSYTSLILEGKGRTNSEIIKATGGGNFI